MDDRPGSSSKANTGGRADSNSGASPTAAPVPDDAALARDRARRLETLHRLALAAQGTQPSQPAGSATTLPSLLPAAPAAPAAPASPASPASPAAAPAGVRSSRRRFSPWLAAGAILLCLAVVAGLILHAGQQPPRRAAHSTPAGPVVIRPALDGLTCLSDAAWSPRGDRAAVIGSAATDSCPGAGLLYIYDTAGKITARLHPDQAVLDALLSAPGVPAGPNDTPTIVYTHVLWSADGATLALTGFVRFPDIAPPATAPALTFLELAPTDGHLAIASLVGSSESIPGVLWNLTGTPTGTILPSRSPLGPLASAVGFVLPVTSPSLGYQWISTGALAPTQQLFAQFTPPAPPLGPVGSPVRDPQFTVWQPGQAELQLVPLGAGGPTGPTAGVGVYTWASVFATWSPDGHYLLDSVSVFDRIQPPGLPDATPQRLDELGLTGIPLLPLRDAALGAVFAGMQTGSFDPASQHVALAWRPDGRVLAATSLFRQFTSPFASGSAAPPPHVVTLYDCASGHVLASLPIPNEVISNQFDPSTLRWSADGTHLLLYEASSTTIVIWGPIGHMPAG